MKSVRLAFLIALVVVIGTDSLGGPGDAPTPTPCAPGSIPIGGHLVFQSNGPAVMVGQTCVNPKDKKFKPISVDLTPPYILLTIIPAVPGNQSEMKYGSGSSVGSRVETKNTFKVGFEIVTETNATSTDFVASQGAITGSAVEMKKEQSATLTVSSTVDPIKGDNDLFYLWMNPVVQVTQYGPNQISMVHTTATGEPMLIVPVTASDLRDPSRLPKYKSDQLAKLSEIDRQAILALDPLASNQPLDSNRFKLVNTLQLDGPDQPGDPIPGQGLTISSEVSNSNISGRVNEVSISFLIGGGVSWGVIAKCMAGVKLEYDYESTNEASTGLKQEGEVTLKTSTVGYHDVVDVYADTLFNSFAFVSQSQGRGLPAKHPSFFGVVKAADGRAMSNKLVAVKLADGRTRRVFTNAQGIFRVFNAPPGTVKVRVDAHELEIEDAARKRPIKFRVESEKPRP